MNGEFSYHSGASFTVSFMTSNRNLPNPSGVRFKGWFSLLSLTGIWVFLSVQLWFGPSNVIALKELQRDIQLIKLANTQLHQRNHMLLEEILELRHGLDAIEERARHELGLIAQDEVFVWLVPKN